ncbi:ubiE/COQ5 methyltransferase [Mollisia scopiformis]|uniref:UbiE/COQ5 methyltransferase n=1 Tax=Mollisia scopiformis TaxID=149040 RepID=A0A132B3Q3_MOLSC|nr:ubiE/COQ5 methyltransferase [Mollisia scopiformis]KUJ06554.1 ubiE/COQ5 methyltransferase [Mollisia scopiformis]
MSKDSVYVSDHSASVLATHSWRTARNSIPYLIPHLKSNFKILDIGCGPGTITTDLAKLVPEGHVTGVEYKPEPLENARALAAEQGVTNIDFQVADIHNLPFENGSFDVVHVHQVLQHIRDPVEGLREMKRVAKKGGIVACRESADMTWYPQSEGLTKWKQLYMRVAKARGSNPHPGSRIHVWAKEAGFKAEDVKCSVGTWLYASKDEIEYWSGIWPKRTLESSFRDFAIEGGHCKQEDLRDIADAWRQWGQDEDAWFTVLHGETICKV